MDYIRIIFSDIFSDLKNYSIPALLFAVLIMGIRVLAMGVKIEKLPKKFWKMLKKSHIFRYEFLFAMYAFFIADKTLFSRTVIWENPLSLFMGDWILFPLNTQSNDIRGAENIIFFIPYMFFFMGAFLNRIGRKKVRILLESAYTALLTSFFIETSQLVFKVGTFQLSDLVYNTLGGLVGAGLYILWCKFHKRKK